jgi:hypothetical protein
MKKLGRAFLALTVGSLSSLALVASAAGTTATQSKQVKHLTQPVAALAVDGANVAYNLSARDAASKHAINKVLVWNVRTGKTVTVSGKKTAVADDTSTGEGVLQLAIAGSRVAWLVNEGGNLEASDFLFTSSVTQPKERQVASALRNGDGGCSGRDPTGCTGAWLGGLVGSGNTIAVNRWTTDSTGHIGSGGLYSVNGTQLKTVATGTSTLQAVSSDAGREAVLHSDGSVAVYSKSGAVLMTLPPASANEAALGGKNLVAVTRTRQLQVYDVSSGSLEKTLPTHGTGLHNLDLQGNIAIYTTGPRVRAVNLSSGKTSAVVALGKHNEILFARISSAGVAYAVNGVRVSFGKGTLGFVPMARLKAAVD